MYISHWLIPVSVLGPGERLCLYVRGCSRGCPGCIAPEFQTKGTDSRSVEELGELLNEIIFYEKCDGVTISGGEPFEQADELLELCSMLRTDDILVYSGFSFTELKKAYGERISKSGIGVLITEPYIEEQNDDLPLRGSSNQEIIFLKEELRARYESYLTTSKRKIQKFVNENGETFFSGIPEKKSRKCFVMLSE